MAASRPMALSAIGVPIRPEPHIIGKLPRQKMEGKYLTFPMRLKRLARQTLCFSQSTVMQDAVIGVFINQYEFASGIS